MPKLNAPLDLSRRELRNAVTQNLGNAPTTPKPGLRYFDSTLQMERYWNGTKWIDIGSTDLSGLGALAFLDQVGTAEIAPGSITNTQISSTAAIALSKLAVNPLDRANHTGTQLAATVSDFDAQVRTNRLDQMAMPTATVNFGGQIVAGAAGPEVGSDLANKDYVDQMALGLSVKDACRVASTGPVTISAPGAAIDGVTLVSGDRVLLKDQANAAANGVYVFNGAASAMTRSLDANQDSEITQGLYVFIIEGGTNETSGWLLSTPDPITVNTTPLTFVQFNGGGPSYIGTTNRIDITGNQINISTAYLGQASITTVGTITAGTWHGTPIDVAHGGTGATTVAGARLALGAIGKYPTTIGDGATMTFTIKHDLNTTQVGVELYEVATGRTVYADVHRTDANNVVIDGFVKAPETDALGVVVWG